MLLTLRTLEPDDGEALVSLFTRNDVQEVTRWFDPFPLDAGTARALSRHEGRDLYWGGWAGSELVAFAMTRGWDGKHPHPAYGCFVDRGRQRRGVGRTLTGLALEQLSERGVPEVRARVHDDNVASLRMLSASGFEEFERAGGRVLLAARPGLS